MTKREVAALVKQRGAVRLDLGCGPNKQAEDWIGVDTRKLPGVDVIHDLEVMPWPIPSSCAQTVVMSHFWEHIKPWLTLSFMAELHRVCQDGAQVMISAPYGNGSRYIQDPTHCNPSNEGTWFYWDSNHPLWGVYKPPVFHVEYYERVPIGGGTDFNCMLRVCKPGRGKRCPHKGVQNG